MDYVVIIEQGQTGYGAYVPDLPGCIAVGDSKEEARELITEAIRLHIEDIRQRGDAVPTPTSSSETVRVA